MSNVNLCGFHAHHALNTHAVILIITEPPHGVIVRWENGGQNNQGAGSKVGKGLESRE